jgi:uncharacterized phage protein (TIGR02220 family)
MAENKKSIIIYADWKTTFEQLDDDEAGRLIKHFFRYVNDENPIAPDKLTQVCFEPIKQQLKRDLIKWEEIKLKRSKAGQISAELRKKTNSTHVEQTPTHVENDPTNSTVNVNVNVNDIKDNIVDVESTFFGNEVLKPDKSGLDFVALLHFINEQTGRKFKAISKIIQQKYNARLKEGYSRTDIGNAIKNACKTEYHIGNGFQYLTPEFFSRSSTLDKYGSPIAETKSESKFIPNTKKRSR